MRVSVLGSFLALVLVSPSALALEVNVPLPPPTLVGEETELAAELSDVQGTAQIRWDFGDGTVVDFAEGEPTTSHLYEAPGHYTINALVQDESGYASATFIHVVHTQPLDGDPRTSSRLLYDATRNVVVTANEGNGTVTVVDAETLDVVAEIRVFDHPVALAMAPSGLLWVVDREDYAITIVDLDEGKAVDFFRLPYASQPIGIVIAEDGDAFIPLFARGDVVRVDGATHEIKATRHIAPHVRGITLSSDDASLWVTRFITGEEHGEIHRLDPTSLDPVARIDLAEDTTTMDSDVQGRGLPNYLFSLSISPDGTTAWVPGKKDNMSRGLMRDGLAITQDSAVRPLVSVLDLDSDTEILAERMDLDDRNLPHHVTFSPLGDWAFISVFGSNLIDMRDAFNRSFITALRAPKLKGPVATVLTADHRLFVLAESSRHLIVFDVEHLMSGVDRSTKILAELPLVQDETLLPQVLLGKQIFENAEDKRMASEGYLSCASCHFDGFEDGRIWDFFDRGEGLRNTSSLLGRRGVGHGRLHWSGNFDEIQDFENPIRSHQAGLGFLTAEQFATGTVGEPLGDPKAGLNAELDALAAYVTSLGRVPRSPHRNADGSLTQDAEAGQALFIARQCDTCHGGEDFTNSAAHVLYDVGTMTTLSGSRLGEALTGIDTPTLLGLWQTAPYLHDGSAATLRDVLTTHNPEDKHGITSDLSAQQLDQLVAYLEQIDHGQPPRELTLPITPSVGEGGSGLGGAGPVGTGGDASGGAPSEDPSGTGGDTTDTGGAPSTPTAPAQSGCACRVGTLSGSSLPSGWPFAFTVLGLWARRRSRREQGPAPGAPAQPTH